MVFYHFCFSPPWISFIGYVNELYVFFSLFFSISFLGTILLGFIFKSRTDQLKLSGLLENDDIVVSRRANSYVLTAVGKTKVHNTKLRANGLETMLKKAGAGKYCNK